MTNLYLTTGTPAVLHMIIAAHPNRQFTLLSPVADSKQELLLEQTPRPSLFHADLNFAPVFRPGKPHKWTGTCLFCYLTLDQKQQAIVEAALKAPHFKTSFKSAGGQWADFYIHLRQNFRCLLVFNFATPRVANAWRATQATLLTQWVVENSAPTWLAYTVVENFN